MPPEAMASFCVSLQDEGVAQWCRELEKKSDAGPAELPLNGAFLPSRRVIGDHFSPSRIAMDRKKTPLSRGD
jgi:hypothetical protein